MLLTIFSMDFVFTTNGDFSSLILILFDPFRAIYLYNVRTLALGVKLSKIHFLTIILNIGMFFFGRLLTALYHRAKQHEGFCSVMWLNAHFSRHHGHKISPLQNNLKRSPKLKANWHQTVFFPNNYFFSVVCSIIFCTKYFFKKLRWSELIRLKVLYSPKPEINRRQRNFQSQIILSLQINSKILSLYIHPFSFFRFLKFFLTKIPSIARNRIFCWLFFFLPIRYYTCSKRICQERMNGRF